MAPCSWASEGSASKAMAVLTAKGFAHAIDVAADLVRNGFNEHVKEELDRYGDQPAHVAAAMGGS